MKNKTHIGNVTLVLDRHAGSSNVSILLGYKRSRQRSDDGRKRKRIGIGLWVPPGGATESGDKSQKHAAQRELKEEVGLLLPLRDFKKVGILKSHLDSVRPTWIVHIYMVVVNRSCNISISSHEYIEVRWFLISNLPIKKMLKGDGEWLPRIVKGEKLSITIVASENVKKTHSINVVPISSFN